MDVVISKDEITGVDVSDGKCVLPLIGSAKVGTNGSLRGMHNGFVVGQSYLRHITSGVDFVDSLNLMIGKQNIY